MPKKKKVETQNSLSLDDYSEEFLKKFISAIELTKSKDVCKAMPIQQMLKADGEDELEFEEIFNIYGLLQAQYSDNSKKDEFSLMIDKTKGIAILNGIVNNGNSSTDAKLKALSEIAKLGNWYEEKEAQEVIDSNNQLMKELDKYFTPLEQEYIGFNFIEEEIVENIDETVDEDNDSIIDKVEIV